MRFPLRYQLLLPMLAILLAGVVGVTALNAYWSVQRTRNQIEADLTQVTQTLVQSQFPLTDGVLEQMKGLAGAEFVLTDGEGKVVSASGNHDTFTELRPLDAVREQSPVLAKPVLINHQRYYQSAVDMRRPGNRTRATTLHILYPEANYVEQWRDVVYPPLLVGGGALVLAVGLSLAVAAHVTRPLQLLQVKVREIAQGNFQPVSVPARHDEISDLSRSVNQMAEQLAKYESEVRRNEQLRTLGQLGGGIAHQLRNSVTGCRLAVELHARDCPSDAESLDVAQRQLALIERYLQRFLSLGRREERPHDRIDLLPIVENVLALVGPTARHVGVQMEAEAVDAPVEVLGDADALEQLLVNLVLNGVEAAAEHQARQPGTATTTPPDNAAPEKSARHRHGSAWVRITVERSEQTVTLGVEDTGKGPAVAQGIDIFEPFVTEKPDGTGLGLSVAREIVLAHGGNIGYRRQQGRTQFFVQLPASDQRG